ncbi:hypothetical protein [Marinomonas pollencensis]|uniref:Uncharacterized protein n=1 Tax=Marinomonas pollencensis TaxID=491954 RepID=A0A3E0DR94_9GAMM|nr:hypothetical protein [Marinomonas pollencensis]REG85620.1 hypothetical protein DFP81_102153 [Marinomonas pollencensis]
MRDYGKVYTRFWLKQNITSWSDPAKLLGLYLLTCPHCNLLGCFRLPSGYVASDLNWDNQQVLAALNELEKDRFLIRCESSGWTLIRSFLKHNPIENPNQGKAAFRLLKDVPADFVGMASLLKSLAAFQARLPEEFSSLFISDGNPVRDSQRSDDSERSDNSTVKTVNYIQFEDFWDVQIRKEKKAKAKEEWLRMALNEDHELALEVLTRWKEQRDNRLQYQDRTKTPLPHNWLFNRQWEDEYVRIDEAQQTPTNLIRSNHQFNIEESNRRIAESWAGLSIREADSNAAG